MSNVVDFHCSYSLWPSAVQTTHEGRGLQYGRKW